MTIVMMFYYLLSICLVAMLIYSFVKEKKSITDMLLYLIIAIPFVLRILRVK